MHHIKTVSFSHASADVIHTVGPIAQRGVGEAQRSALRSCYKNSLKTATDNAAHSVVSRQEWDEGKIGVSECLLQRERKRLRWKRERLKEGQIKSAVSRTVTRFHRWDGRHQRLLKKKKKEIWAKREELWNKDFQKKLHSHWERWKEGKRSCR